MPEHRAWVAVVPLPERINRTNAGRVRERLLWVVNRGAAVVVADLTATLSCDSSGADALQRAYQRAMAGGTELWLAVTGGAVRRALSRRGLLSLAPMYPTLDAALAASHESHRQPPQQRRTPAFHLFPPSPEHPARGPAADLAQDPLDSAVASIFTVALSLQNVTGLPAERIAECITDSVGKLDNAIRDIREHAFAEQCHARQTDDVTQPQPDTYERLAQTAQRTAAMRQQLIETAHALQAASAETAALITQRRYLAEEPHRVDYPTRIKRWQAIADAAQRMVDRWEDN